MSENRKNSFDVAVLGAGPGGYVAALQAAKLGAKVALIEKENIGGTCLNWGCIPTKALLSSANIYQQAKNASAMGININDISYDMNKISQRKDRVVARLVKGIEYLLKNEDITVIEGQGNLSEPNKIKVTGENFTEEIQAENIIIATGSKAAELAVPGRDLPAVIGSREALSLTDLPREMAIVGGGVIGMEFAYLFASLDVKVTVIEYMDSILPGIDKDIVKELQRTARRQKISLHTSSELREISTLKEQGEQEKLQLQYIEDSEEKSLVADLALIAVGRVPSLSGIDTEKLGLEKAEQGKGIAVNERMETNCDNIYAIGDVTNKNLLAHVAMHQGIVAAKNICGKSATMNYQAVPSAIFTSPEIATVGLGEEAAKEKGYEIKVAKFPYSANGKVLAAGERQGFAKLIADSNSGKLLGGAIVGMHATDLIATITLAIEQGLKAKEIGETIFAHPTTSEVIHEAALGLEGGALHQSE